MQRTLKIPAAIPKWAGVILSALTFAATAEVADNIKKSFAVAASGTLIMDVDRGSIEITTGSSNDVSVEVIRKVDSFS